MSNNRRVKAIVAGLFLVSAVVLASCEEEPMAMKMTLATINAWVGGPPDGAEIPLGENPVLCHFFAVGGVASGELWVNGSFANGAANPDPGNEYFTAELSFQAPAPGTYVLECVTTDHADNQAWSEPSTVFVSGEPAPPPPPPEVPTATPTETEVPPEVPTATPTSTAVPTHTPTSTAVPTNTPTSTPTSTPTPPLRVVITRFEVSKTQITKGECVRFDWQVQAPTEIYFDGQGVTENPGSEDRCPTSTRAYELVANGYGGPVTASITVVVIPGDTEGPAIGRVGHSPGLIYWDEYDSCTPTYPIEVGINAYNVTDPSGVSAVKVAYRVVEAGRPAGQWQAKPMSQVQTGIHSAAIGPNDLELSLNPPVSYGYGNTSTLQYYIQAFDSVGNRSDSSTRTVTVQYCYVVE
ncbi:MAG: hypothetical protein GTO63_29630 [Anaerolineae bacterium]|nr:hypothetical protein [Anaerolineae bacterium]NIN98877.1 hypothetical protein [Anaerolineae bacterium]NIQ81788.1 hypothetical protein [Anaerolineae bacterium]